MVKVDVDRDYYADLDLPCTADTETIKKKFRELAKQYHPDRNPGHEAEVVPKFQAIRAAHEVLCDATQKAKYDAERARLNKVNSNLDPYGAKRPVPTKTASNFTNVPFPPPPRPPPQRDPNVRSYPTGRTPTAASADRFAAFTRGQSQQQWDRARFEETKAEAFRTFNAMKGNQAPQTPPRPRPPTAPRSTVPSPTRTGPGFPGLSRSQSARKKGYAPGAAGDEPRATSSAYAHVHRSDRPPSASANNFPNAGLNVNMPPPPAPPTPRMSRSPLRPSKSSGFEDVKPTRPVLSRTSSRYATSGGEKLDLGGSRLGRSSSMRNSPIDQRWEERGPFGTRAQNTKHDNSPRHRSASPKLRPGGVQYEFSASETSSDDDDVEPEARPKAQPRAPRSEFHHKRAMSGDDPALTGHFPNTNYTRIIGEEQYHYPAPETRTHPTRHPFPGMSPTVEDITATMNGAGIRHVHKDDVHGLNPQDPVPVDEDSQRPASPDKFNTPFSAHDWHNQFENGNDLFTPRESTSRDRRSPSKTTRAAPRSTTRARGFSQVNDSDNTNVGIDSGVAAGVQHLSPEDVQAKKTAFQAGKFSAEDWVERLRSQNDQDMTKSRSSKPVSNPMSNKAPRQSLDRGYLDPNLRESFRNHSRRPSTGTDAMEVDEPPVPDPHTQPNVSGGQNQDGGLNNHAANGINLNEFTKTAPFAHPSAGLQDMDDLASTLPFESRPAKDLNLGGTKSTLFRELQLPRPPKPVLAPSADHITQDSWRQYAAGMSAYMHDWNAFNAKMIEHFKVRQEQVNHGMYHNWLSAAGDGASADEFEATHGDKKAGYATYMTWLDNDTICRNWWDAAYEEHRKCLEDLGNIRRTVKSMR